LSEIVAADDDLAAECAGHQIGGILLPLHGALCFQGTILLKKPPSQPYQAPRRRYSQN
jgi:hypothetical protein